MFSENQLGPYKDYVYPNTHVTDSFKLVHMIFNIAVRHCGHYICFNGVKTCTWVHLGSAERLVHISAWRTFQPSCYNCVCSLVANIVCDIWSFLLRYKTIKLLNVVADPCIQNIPNSILGSEFAYLDSI